MQPFDQLDHADTHSDELGELVAQAYFVAREESNHPVFLLAQLAHRVAADIDPIHAAYVRKMRDRMAKANGSPRELCKYCT